MRLEIDGYIPIITNSRGLPILGNLVVLNTPALIICLPNYLHTLETNIPILVNNQRQPKSEIRAHLLPGNAHSPHVTSLFGLHY